MHNLTHDEAAALDPPPTPLLVALWEGDLSAALALVATGADPNAADFRPVIGHGATPLHFAADMDDPELVRALITAGAQVNSQSLAGQTPLCRACNAGRASAACVLLAAGADPNIRCIEGYSPLGRVYQSEPVLVELMRSHGGAV
jgi:ankyrin repeat protein